MKIFPIAALPLLLGIATSAMAHEDYRTIGVIANRVMKNGKLENVEVRAREGDTHTLWISPQSNITQDGKKVSSDELRVGQTVVIDSYGDDLDYSEALQVKI